MSGDGVPPIDLKHAAVALLEPIHHLLLFVCQSHTYLKSGVPITVLLYINQEKARFVVSNYHPAFLLCCISKVLEGIIFDTVFDSVATSFI